MKQTLYSSRSNLYIGFHGCDKSVGEMILHGGSLKPSHNDYDWLGHGVYFWENNEQRDLPINKNIGSNGDLLLRHLDCAVIEYEHAINEMAKVKSFDSVRGVFVEGNDLYPGGGIKEKNHIQICVRNPNCIKGYFLPRMKDEDYSNPE